LTRRLPTALLMLLCASVVAVAATTFLTVSPTNLQGWQIQRSASGTMPTPTPTPDVVFVNGPGTPPLGTGSAEFRIGPDGGAAAQLRHPGYAGTRLPNPSPTQPPAANELSSLSYATYVQQDGSGGQAPYIILQIDTDGDAGIEDLLFFEPVYQSATFCPSNPQPALVTGQWQTWDAFNGCWYSVFGTAGSGPGTNTVSLRTLSAALPTGVIANSSPSGLGGVRLVTGFGAGAWDNFIGNADAFRIGVGANDTLYNFDPAETTPTVGPPSTLSISEARFRGPNGLEDEFIEIFNNTNAAHVVSPPDGSGGYSVVGSDGVVRGTIPFGTVIPARGHYLFANSDGYSLGAYPGGVNTTATPDATYTDDLPNLNSAGVALFTTSNPANMTLANRFDAFGFTGATALYREGSGFPTVAVDFTQHTYYRDLRPGSPKDTDNNAADFALVAADTTDPSRPLGAPGPANRNAPRLRGSSFPAELIDGGVSVSSYPNRERRPGEVGTNADLGTLYVRRKFTNNTGDFVARLRFRVVEITTLNSPNVCGPTGTSACADLRALTSQTEVVTQSSSGTVTVEGVTLEEPPTQALGGGNNSSLSADNFINLDVPLAPGASVYVNFKTGVMRGGTFRYFVMVEAVSCTEAGVSCDGGVAAPSIGPPSTAITEN
ncbi:MAG TPA: hypothetical protein VEQ42_12120, partial [Pyrinomonadaceae bacterium]|nr:hypothetical protein [Pyrinomonadaceae bacterium]